MNKGSIAFIFAAVVLLGVFFWGWLDWQKTNDIAKAMDEVKIEKSKVADELMHRLYLIRQLMLKIAETAPDEDQTYMQIASARDVLSLEIAKWDVEKIKAINDSLSMRMKQLSVIQDSYPELKNNQEIVAMQQELAAVSQKLKENFKQYNAVAEKYNSAITKGTFERKFAKKYGFKRMELFPFPF